MTQNTNRPSRARRRPSRWLRAALLSLAFCACAAIVLVYVLPQHASRGSAGRSEPTSPTTAATATPASPRATPSDGTGARPVRLLIPGIGVDTVIEQLGETPNGDMDVPRNVQDAGWYAPGSVPATPAMRSSTAISTGIRGRRSSSISAACIRATASRSTTRTHPRSVSGSPPRPATAPRPRPPTSSGAAVRRGFP